MSNKNNNKLLYTRFSRLVKSFIRSSPKLITSAAIVLASTKTKQNGFITFFHQNPPTNLVLYPPFKDGAPLNDTRQLAHLLTQPTNLSPEQIGHLRELAFRVIDEFSKQSIKSQMVIRELVVLASIPIKCIYQQLIEQTIQPIRIDISLNLDLLRGLTKIIQSAGHDFVTNDNVEQLFEILEILANHLQTIHQQQSDTGTHHHLYEVVRAIASLLDAMVDINITGLSCRNLYVPLYEKLSQLSSIKENLPLAYQATYACQALLHMSNDEQLWPSVLRQTLQVTGGVLTLTRTIKTYDPTQLEAAFKSFNEAFKRLKAVTINVQQIFEGVESSNNSSYTATKQPWYTALRYMDFLIKCNQMIEFEKFVRSAGQRQLAFLWGLCEQMEQLVIVHSDETTRQNASQFLKDIYQNTAYWGTYAKQHKTILQSLVQSTEPNSHFPISLIDAAQKRPPVEADILNLKKMYLQDADIQGELKIYVPQRGKLTPWDTDTFLLYPKVRRFIKDSTKKVLLLLGDPGAGKSTFNRFLVNLLWDEYQTTRIIPLFISLPLIHDPVDNLIPKYLKKMGFSDVQIKELKENHKFVFILDDYDEINEKDILYKENHLEEWNAHVIISFRTDYLGTNSSYQTWFKPDLDCNDPNASTGLQELVVTSFSEKEIDEYIKQYINLKKSLGEMDNYQKVVNDVPNLKELLKNPFILKIALDTLPVLVEIQTDNLSYVHITRLDIYEKFLEQWFKQSEARILDTLPQLSIEMKEAFEELAQSGFTMEGIKFSMRLAVKMLQQGNQIGTTYDPIEDKGTWKQEFFGDTNRVQILCQASPLKHIEHHYSFLYKSLLDYCVARAIFESQCTKPDTILNQLKLVNAPSILRFLVEYVCKDQAFKQVLLKFIRLSKKNKVFKVAAANAITVLVKAGVQFNGQDLQGIRIPGADLSYGVFDYAQLQGADLSRVTLQGSWLRGANLSGANLTNVEFGENPYLGGDDEGKVNTCCYSKDGGLLAMGKSDKIILYNAQTLEELHTLEGHAGSVMSISFSPDGSELTSGCWDMSVQFWSVKEKNLLHTLKGHTSHITCISFSPDGSLLATGSWNRIVRLWCVKEKKLLYTLEGHKNFVKCVSFSPDGSYLATGSNDKTVRLWSVKEQKLLHTFEEHTQYVLSVSFSPDGSKLVSGSWDKTIRLWSVKEQKLLHTLEGHTDAVLNVSFSPDGSLLASGSCDNTVRLWSVEEAKLLNTFEGHTDSVCSVSFSPDGSQLASGSFDKTVRLWSVKKQTLLHTSEKHIQYGNSVQFSPNGSQFALASDHTVQLWSVKELKLLYTLEGHTDCVKSVEFSPDGTQLASGCVDNTLRLWSVDGSPKLLHTLQGNSFLFSPDGSQLASVSRRTTQLWSVKEQMLLCTLKGHTDRINSASFSPDGFQLALGSEDCTVLLWSIEERKFLFTFKGHSDTVYDVAFSPNGSQLASGSGDHTVRIWSIAEEKLLHTLKGHTGSVLSISFSPDGSRLASGGTDKTVRLWSIVSGQCIAVIENFSDVINSVSWKNTPSGMLLLTGGGNKTVRLWHVKNENNNCQVILHWTSAQTVLTASQARIGDVIGLSFPNMLLLKQLGAVDESSGEQKKLNTWKKLNFLKYLTIYKQ